MKTKTVKISFKIPARFKWIAQFRYGEWVAFVNKPEIVREVEGDDSWVTWSWKGETLSLSSDEMLNTIKSKGIKNWEKTLRKI